jgi:exonuclease III
MLVIMTLNAEFLWDGVEPEEGQVDFPWKFSQTEAEDHMREVADIIIRGNPDIVNLVEVENLDALKTFNDKFLAGRGYRPYLVKGKDTFTGQDVALLTRIDPEDDLIERDDRRGQSGSVTKSVSKNFFAKIQVNDAKIVLIGLHFLAQPLRDDRRLPRQAQADAIRALAVEKRNEGFSPIVLGDFNDFDGEEMSRDHVDSLPVTGVLSMVKGMDPADPSDDLVNAASFLPKMARFTAFHDANDNGNVDPPQEFTSIDHILLSPDLTARVDLVEILHDHDPRHVTDHFPVVVQLRLGEGPQVPPAFEVRIASLLPNPAGNENQNEQATIQNLGTEPVDLTSWKLRDLAGRSWSLDELGVLEPGEEKTITRNGQPMALNNNGDTVDLIDSAGRVLDTVSYSRVEEGEIVTPAN